jgi:hypothetical protein
MVPDFVVNSADGADAPITLPVITSPVTGRQLAANAGRILAASWPDFPVGIGANARYNLARFRYR